MEILRTPEPRFIDLPDFPYQPHYLDVELKHESSGGAEARAARMHYVDEGPTSAPVVLMLHGEPSWSFAWRHVIGQVSAAGYRAVAPDHIGFGKSDKLAHRDNYTYAGFVDWMASLVEQLDLHDITLLCQDWGGPIGLSVLARMPERFTSVIVGNTLLPNCQPPPQGVADWPGEVVSNWVALCREADDLPVAEIVAGVCVEPLNDAVKAAYDAPFPDASYKAAVLAFPGLIPISENMAGTGENRLVWDVLEQWNQLFVTAFSDSDPSTAAWASVFRDRIPGAQNDLHTTIASAGHFLQEEQGAALADVVLKVLAGKN